MEHIFEVLNKNELNDLNIFKIIEFIYRVKINGIIRNGNKFIYIVTDFLMIYF